MILNKTGLSYHDLTIVPETISDINSRSVCNPYDGTVNNGVNDVLNIWGMNTEERLVIVDEEKMKRDFIHYMKTITKESYGMSTKKAQKLINPTAQTKTSEGCTKYIQVKEIVHQWSDNMISYLKSAMSYTNKRTLSDFRGHVNFIINSSCAILAVNK